MFWYTDYFQHVKLTQCLQERFVISLQVKMLLNLIRCTWQSLFWINLTNYTRITLICTFYCIHFLQKLKIYNFFVGYIMLIFYILDTFFQYMYQEKEGIYSPPFFKMCTVASQFNLLKFLSTKLSCFSN